MSRSDDLTPERLRARARLLEFLKFRVLASQETFFEAWRLDLESGPGGDAVPSGPSEGLPPLDLAAFRSWLQQSCPEASRLCDADLRHGLEQANRLYVDPPSRRPD